MELEQTSSLEICPEYDWWTQELAMHPYLEEADAEL
jgi:hypothetical protein